MWVKEIDGDYNVTHVDWRPMYNGLRDAAICKQGSGYMIHEGCRWSSVHDMYFFLPRKVCTHMDMRVCM